MLDVALIFQTLAIFFFGLSFSIFVLYGSIILYYSKFNKIKSEENFDYDENETKTKFEPTVSIVVPTHNEELIISKKIESLLAINYPLNKTEIIFVDDSNDSTPHIIMEYEKKYSFIILIRFGERMGYSHSMINGCKKAKGEIIILGDAGSFLDPQAIRYFVEHFKNQEVGAVTGRDVILNHNEEIGKSENLYYRIFNFLRIVESKMDSTFFIKGEATAVRSCLIKDLENCSATFDTAVGLFLRQKGFKTLYDPDIKFYEYAPLTHFDRIKQKTIRAANLIRVIFQYKHLIFKRKYEKYGLIILPMYFGMIVIAPAAIFTGFLFLILTTIFNFTFSIIIWGVIVSLLLISLLISRDLLFTFLDFETSLLKALYEIAIHKTHDKIDTVTSTRRSI